MSLDVGPLVECLSCCWLFEFPTMSFETIIEQDPEILLSVHSCKGF